MLALQSVFLLQSTRVTFEFSSQTQDYRGIENISSDLAQRLLRILTLIIIKFRVEFLGTFRTNTMAKISI